MASFVRATAVASAAAPGTTPDLPLPPPGGDWMARADAIAGRVAAALKAKAELGDAEWRRLPCLVGSSSHFIGAREAQARRRGANMARLVSSQPWLGTVQFSPAT